jgi:hypothetical protein
MEGDLVLASPRLPHAFGAAAELDADMLVVIAPGVERSDISAIFNGSP